MARRGEIYSSGWLKASDLLDTGKETGLDLTIKAVRTSEMDDGKVQRTISFVEDDRELGLNVTNWDSLAILFKKEDDEDWIGGVCNVHPHRLDRPYNGKTHGIRVGAPRGVGPARTTVAPATSAGMTFAAAVEAVGKVMMTRDGLVEHLKANGHSVWNSASCTPIVLGLIKELSGPKTQDQHKPMNEEEIPF